MPSHSVRPPRAADAAAERRLGVALWLAAHGYPVHPLKPGAKTPAANCESCRREAHQPADCPCLAHRRWCHGFHAATTDTTLIQDWWSYEPGFGVGVSCGPAGLVVIDVDAHTDVLPPRDRLLPGIPIDERVDLTGLSSGYDTLALLAAYRGRPDPTNDATTLRVRTPSGGLHIWYRTSPGTPAFRSSSGTSTRVALAWQVDVRATGGYIIAPTTHTAAGTYEALPGSRTPALLPLWLSAELTRTGHALISEPTRPARAPHRSHSTAPQQSDAHRILGLLLDEVRQCAQNPTGTAFSEKLNRAAFTAGGLAAGGHLTQHETLDLLTAAADAARPQQPRRNRHIIDSALRAGSTRPIHPKGRS
ncbi:bifunctional DNA primase/polymerase [Streptomyces sp. NPDC093225]|uniref:bifunctional DNA primase/polymerase n=1 Tax=Streptomyces sp. NPDC093225 TaxID=3366034 RepID=UPI0038251B3E